MKKNGLWFVVLTAVAVLGACATGGYIGNTKFEWEGDFAWVLQDNGNAITIIGYNGEGSEITIPSLIQGKPVTYIEHLYALERSYEGPYSLYFGRWGFGRRGGRGHPLLTGVIIPDSVTRIGNGAFADNQLSSVVIGNSVTSIEAEAFRGNQLASVTIPASVTSIEASAFADNRLSSVVIGNGVTSIGNYAFANNSLVSVSIGNGVTSIGDRAFEKNSLVSITIPGNVASIGQSAFANNSLVSVSIGNGVTSIG
ncbi:MAG: leucine-rich repeat domain-containing protein, partial [Treponema sp.]|nr:leucine-rich repeat domain-containing protein [Treponema sp.]